MHTLNVELGSRSYPIHIGPGLLSRAPSLIQPGKRQLRLITDSNVAPHYLAPLRDSLGLREEQIRVLPAGEGYKTWDSAGELLDWLLQTRLSRDGWLIALGGGVMGDLIGFAAAIYQRGVDFVQVPTTLLAQVDSSVGGKTGVNHARGKNMIGAFHQPRLVLADTDTLRTLPHRELLAGLAEVIKYGMLADATFFDWLEAQIDALLAQDASAMTQAIRRSCELKAGIVAMDERETVAGGAGPRAWLNLGHTFGHAIETWTGYTQWLHGEAVGAGLCMAADLSARLGWISEDSAQRCIRLVGHTGLPTRAPAGMRPQDFRDLMQLDKKVASGRLRLVLMRKLGEACVSEDFDDAALAATLDRFTRD